MGVELSKNIIVTGGSSGIGLEVAKQFTELGYKVFIIDVNECPLKASNIEFFKCDISKINKLKETIDLIASKVKSRIDFLFANAGIYNKGDLLRATEDEFEEVVGINIKGTFFTLKYTLPYMKEKGGSIVISGSDQSLIGKKNCSIYGLTKGALAQLTKSTAI